LVLVAVVVAKAVVVVGKSLALVSDHDREGAMVTGSVSVNENAVVSATGVFHEVVATSTGALLTLTCDAQAIVIDALANVIEACHHPCASHVVGIRGQHSQAEACRYVCHQQYPHGENLNHLAVLLLPAFLCHPVLPRPTIPLHWPLCLLDHLPTDVHPRPCPRHHDVGFVHACHAFFLANG
jgi:hypothetical protein